MTATISLPFTEQECDRAFREWGCNCGPSALAAVIGFTLDDVRPAVEAVGFAAKKFMSPTMMKNALAWLGVKWQPRAVNAFDLGGMAFPKRGLARIQWEGPWTNPGANPKWAYWHTHWVASWKCYDGDTNAADAVWSELTPVIFDVNGGLMDLDRWEDEIVPLITKSIPRADGDWHVTHCWEIQP